MANQGIYREAGGAGGLPLPRSNLALFTGVVAVLAFMAIVMPPALLAVTGRGMAGAWRIFRDGGGSMWLILLCGLLGPVIAAALGSFVLRGRRIPVGLLFIGAGLPFVVALLGAWSGLRMTLSAISGESVDPEQKGRILAEGTAETMSTDLLGGFVVCGIALVAAAGAAAAVATIDRNAASRGGAAPSSSGAIGAGVAGGLWLLASLVLSMVRVRAAGGVVLVTALPVFVLVPLAVLAGRSASVLRAWHDREEASRAAGAIVVAGLSALLAVLVLSRAIESSFLARSLGAISGESVDDSQRARILAEALGAGNLAPISYALHALLGAATFGLALAPALGNGRNPATPSAVAAAITGLALLSGTLALSHSRTAAPRLLASMKGDREPFGVTVPTILEAFSDRGSGPRWDSRRLIIRADGSGVSSSSDDLHADYAPESSCTHPQIAIFADRASTIAMLRMRIGEPKAPACGKNLIFVARREHPPELDARLGDYAGFLGTTEYLAATIDDDPDGPRSSATDMLVKIVADDALEIDGTRVALPLPSDASPARDRRTFSSVSRIRYVVRPTDTMDRVVRTIAAVESAYQGHLDTYALERQLDDGVRAPPPAPSGRTLVGQGGVSVNGRLPPEVIQRIVRQHLGRFRLCYENGLHRDPTLRGRVVVKFVIDRSGSVSTAADGGSELTDSGVVSCIVSAFESLSFPQPEGGIVTVTYPLDFKPAN